jgi:hypothetical protein
MIEPLLEFAGSVANHCEASLTHSPVPVRFVWHHVQPKEAGGQTVAANLVQVCDSCHYTIHRMMWIYALIALAQPTTDAQRALITRPPRRTQLVLAGRGYDACRIAGTISQIPNEG